MSVVLSIGDCVLVKLDDKHHKQCVGLIKYIGMLHGKKHSMKQYIGIQLMEPIKNGHNGTVSGHKYFVAPEGHGALIAIHQIIRKLSTAQLFNITSQYIKSVHKLNDHNEKHVAVPFYLKMPSNESTDSSILPMAFHRASLHTKSSGYHSRSRTTSYNLPPISRSRTTSYNVPQTPSIILSKSKGSFDTIVIRKLSIKSYLDDVSYSFPSRKTSAAPFIHNPPMISVDDVQVDVDDTNASDFSDTESTTSYSTDPSYSNESFSDDDIKADTVPILRKYRPHSKTVPVPPPPPPPIPMTAVHCQSERKLNTDEKQQCKGLSVATPLVLRPVVQQSLPHLNRDSMYRPQMVHTYYTPQVHRGRQNGVVNAPNHFSTLCLMQSTSPIPDTDSTLYSYDNMCNVEVNSTQSEQNMKYRMYNKGYGNRQSKLKV